MHRRGRTAPQRGHSPPFFPPPDVIARAKADAERLLAPQIAGIFVRAAPFFQPIYDLESPSIVFGRVALAGDAAFVARPHVGAGTTKAAVDAATLAECLYGAGDDIASGLARYDHAQRIFGQAMVALSRQEGAYLSAQIKSKDQRGAKERERDIGELLHAHGTRSDQVADIVAARGLEHDPEKWNPVFGKDPAQI